MNIHQFLLVWSEVWALLIPLTVIAIFRLAGKPVALLIAYVITGFFLNFCAIFTLVYPNVVPSFLKYNNNIFYNVHSFFMVIFLGSYILKIRPYKYKLLLKGLIILYVAFVVINFVFFERPLFYSTRHFITGSIVLIVLCLFYFINSIQEESQVNWLKHPSFIIFFGICLYHCVTFFIFLFLLPMFNSTYNKDPAFAHLMMKITQITFVIFCILLAIGLYQYRGLKNKAAA